MNTTKDKNEILAEYLEKHPFLAEIGQMNLSIRQILDGIAAETSSLPGLDAYREDLSKGIPVLQHAECQNALVKPVAHVMKELTKGLLEVEIPAQLKGFCRSLHEYLVKNDAEEIIGYVLRQESEKIKSFSEANSLNEKTVNYIAWLAIGHVLPTDLTKKTDWHKKDDIEWAQNYCPVCGSLPVLAQLKREKQGSDRYLVCGGCHTTWKYKRLGCVYCGNDDLEKMRLLETEAEPEMRLDVCDECHSYIKTYVNEGKESIYLADWATLHLDILGEEAGLKKKGSL